MNKTDALHKINRINRYLLDEKEFEAFSLMNKCFEIICQDLNLDRRAK